MMPKEVAMPRSNDTVRHFVREVLGCGCPDEVLQRITQGQAELSAGLPHCERLDVGGRLLVFVLATGDAAPRPDELRGLLEAGKAERDRLGFNRFRLAIASANPERLHATAEQALADVAAGDDKLHVHVIEGSQAALIDPSFRRD
jgi:hypothetical protein